MKTLRTKTWLEKPEVTWSWTCKSFKRQQGLQWVHKQLHLMSQAYLLTWLEINCTIMKTVMNFLTFWLQFPFKLCEHLQPLSYNSVAILQTHAMWDRKEYVTHVHKALGTVPGQDWNGHSSYEWQGRQCISQAIQNEWKFALWFVCGRDTCTDVCWVFLFPHGSCHVMVV